MGKFYRRHYRAYAIWFSKPFGKPELSKHSKVIEFGLKANADNYIAAGWELIETRGEPFALGRTIIIYRVGWPQGAGEPVLPPTDDDLRDLQEGPSAN